jgi:esterase/lipase superfamily enzyme
MNREYHKWWSPNLEHDMELNIYGHDGKAVIVFPTTSGKFYEYEDFGMVEACQPFIDSGQIKLFTIDSIDNQSWFNYSIHPDERAKRYMDYDKYITQEVVPFVRSHGTGFPKLMVTGCDIGATHAANFFFKHPDIFDTLVALSGLYGAEHLLGDFMDDQTYFHFPLVYLPNLTDSWYLDRYRESDIIFCVGRGAWEQDSLTDTWAIKRVLEEKDIPVWVDFWGKDVNHDWFWWQKQIVYFLTSLPFTTNQQK